jgi:hypothetical protein
MSFKFVLNVKLLSSTEVQNSKYTGHFFEKKKDRVVWNF